MAWRKIFQQVEEAKLQMVTSQTDSDKTALRLIRCLRNCICFKVCSWQLHLNKKSTPDQRVQTVISNGHILHLRRWSVCCYEARLHRYHRLLRRTTIDLKRKSRYYRGHAAAPSFIALLLPSKDVRKVPNKYVTYRIIVYFTILFRIGHLTKCTER